MIYSTKLIVVTLSGFALINECEGSVRDESIPGIPRNLKRPKSRKPAIHLESGVVGYCARVSTERTVCDQILEYSELLAAGKALAELIDMRDPGCPPSAITIRKPRTVLEIDPLEPRFTGSGSSVFVSMPPPEWDEDAPPPVAYAVRLSSASDPTAIYQSINDKAFRQVFKDLSGFTPPMRSVVEGSLSVDCSTRTTVIEFGGEWTLDSFRVHSPDGRRSSDKLVITENVLAGIAVRAIEMVQRIHSLGMLHGDIYERNFVVSDFLDPVGSMKIIDFGRATPFVNPRTGYHVNEFSVRRDESELPAGVLSSPFELDGAVPARRDDMYRIAETLFVILGETRESVLKFERTRAEVSRLKRGWKSSVADSPVFNAFHRAMLRVDPFETPAYRFWIEKFNELASKI